jgi:L-amino acid N-acyltransferase YncA
MIEVRPATDDDLPAITDLYNALIPTTTTAWTEALQTLDERVAWFADRRSAGDAVLVADEGGAVVGFAAYGEFRDNRLWPGYRFTVEHTIHVAQDHHGRGVGRALLEALLAAARTAGRHVMVGAVDGDNEQSLAFHRALGFVEVARMPETGRKFDRWLDLVLLQRRVDG